MLAGAAMLAAQTRTVGPQGQGITEGDRSVFLGSLGIGAPLLSNESRLLPFWKQMVPFQGSADPVGNYVVMCGMLDSIGTDQGPTPYIGYELVSKIGCGALLSNTWGSIWPNAYNLSPSYSGGAALTPATASGSGGVFTYLPNGRVFVIPDGGSVTESPVDPTRTTGFQKVRSFYGIRASGGTISVTVSQNGVALTTKTASTTGTAGTIGYIEHVAADGLLTYGAPTIETTASSGQVDYLGSIVYLRSGALVFQFGRGSTGSTEMATVSNANLTYMQDVLGVSLAIHANKGETNAEIDAWYDRIATSMPKTSHVLIGNSPSFDEANDLRIRERMRLKAAERNLCYFDAYQFLKSYAEMQAMGWTEDATHLTTEPRRLQAGWLANRILNFNLSGEVESVSVLNPVTKRDFHHLEIVRNTARRASFDSLFGSSTGTGWTQTLSRGRNAIGWTTATSNAGVDQSSVDLLLDYQLYGYQDAQYRWQMIENFGTCDSVTAKIAFGTNGFPQFTRSTTGFDWEFGFETIASVLTPWVRFELHDGATRYQSPKFYIPIATGGIGYIKGGGQWHNWALTYDGSGGASKRLRCWVSPSFVANTSAKTSKPILVADWQVAPGNPNWFPATSTTSCSWGALIRGAPASSGSLRILSFETDHNARNPMTLLPF